jgi:citrate/tricarballylate utilization protein
MKIQEMIDLHASETLEEADRLMTVCNSCRYCEGLCAVFPAMEMRRSFADGDLNYLANLCHGCGACLPDCQFSPPHDFNVNVPKTLAKLRGDTYQAYAWPRAFSGVFARNGLAISIIAALSVTGFIFGFAAWNDPEVLFGRHTGQTFATAPSGAAGRSGKTGRRFRRNRLQGA